MKVLQIMNGAIQGGISGCILNYYRHLDKSVFHFDLAMPDVNLGSNGKAFKALGCNIFKLPLKSRNPVKYALVLYQIIKDGQYDAVHVNGNLTSFFPLIIALFAGVKIRVAHAHTARIQKSLSGIFRRFFSLCLTPLVATRLVACSLEAGVAIFGRRAVTSSKFMVLNNGIDVSKYAYSEEKRNQIRKALELGDKFVIGCVGNLGPEKNTIFAIDSFYEILKLRDNVTLIIIGDGELRNMLEKRVSDLEIEQHVRFLGRRNDVNDLLQAMDAFIMPSLYEGFSLAIIEAATSGLPLFLSTSINDNYSFYPERSFISLKEKPAYWAKTIMQYKRNVDRQLCYKLIIDSGYDLETNYQMFERIYK